MMTEGSKALTRKHRRASLDLYINKIVGDEPHLVRVKDISVGGLYLCSAGTHPGGGVTGAPGANAAREVLKDLR